MHKYIMYEVINIHYSRHLKQDVLAQLPAKRRQMIVLDPEAVTSSRSFHQTSCAMEKNISVH